MRHDRDLADQDVEELAEALWTLAEDGRESLAELRRANPVADLGACLAEMARRGLASVEGERVRLTEAGRTLAERQVRRYRLAESLFTTVLDSPDIEAVERTACVIEHVLSPGLTDSVCSFLGHPRTCPHGRPIPPGPCCRTLSQAVEPLVQPLDHLPLGQAARIVYIVPRDPARLVRLSSFGLVPGATVELQQSSPAAVLRVGETTLAVDRAIAGEIYVRRAPL